MKLSNWINSVLKCLKHLVAHSRSPSTGEAETGKLRIWGQPGLLTWCENRNRLLSPSVPVTGLPSRLYKNGQLELDGVWDGTVPGSPSLGGCHMVLCDCQILCLLQNHGCSFYPVTKLTLLCPVWGNTSSISPALSTPLPPVAWLPCLCPVPPVLIMSYYFLLISFLDFKTLHLLACMLHSIG